VIKNFETLNHTADIGIIAYGKDISEVFINAAKGFLSLVIDPKEVSNKETHDIEVAAADREALLLNWLNELIYLLGAKEVLLKDFKVIEITDLKLKVQASGEKIKKNKHHFMREVKAATYHKLKIEQTAEGWRAQVIFDI
jgi:SHS2 domain-containing protein